MSTKKQFLTQIVCGYEDGTVRPDSLLTRAEACKIISMAILSAEHKGINVVKDGDVPKIDFTAISGKHYYIFDDHPEWIRRCDILDDSSFEPALLMSATGLEPGVYTVFSYHHVANQTDDGAVIRFNSGAPFASSDVVYFDAVFSNKTSDADIMIKKLGISNLSDDHWHGITNSWGVFESSELNESKQIEPNTSEWLTDFNCLNRSIKINKDNDFGYVWLMMEFEVIRGSVDFQTVAYKNKADAKTVFDWHNDLINEYPIASTYETLETLKGISNADHRLISRQMVYNISAQTEPGTRLPVMVENDFGSGEQLFFTTNTLPISANNRWTTPGSSVLDMYFDGDAVTRDWSDGSVSSTTAVPGGRWFFDQYHSRFVETHDVPPEGKVGSYSNKSSFAPNEKIDENWLEYLGGLPTNQFKSIVPNFNGLSGANERKGIINNGVVTNVTQEGIIQTNATYGITYEMNVKVTNNDSEPRTFAYVVQGTSYNVTWSVNGGVEQIYYGKPAKINSVEVHNTHAVINEPISSGATSIFKIKLTLMTGASATTHNSFVINPSVNQITEHTYDDNNEIWLTNPNFEAPITLIQYYN